MAITATLVEGTSPNRIRYLLTYAGAGALTITTTGGVTPDLRTNSLTGPIKNLAKAVANGFGAFAAGAMDQDKARALWLSDWSGANPAPFTPADQPNPLLTAIATITPRNSTNTKWLVDADVDGSGNPILVIDVNSTVTDPSTAYLDIEVPGAIGS